MAKFFTVLVALSASTIQARHAHARPQHEHLAPRQVPAVPVAAPNAASLPNAAGAAGSLPNAAGSLPGASLPNAPAVPAAGSVTAVVPGAGSVPNVGTAANAANAGTVAGGLAGGVPVAVPVAPSLPSTGAVTGAVPGTGSLPNAGGVTSLAGSIDTCLDQIPQQLIGIIQAVENRLGNVQSQLANLGKLVSGLPAVSTPGLATPSLPPVSVPTTPSLPVSAPGVPGVPSVPSVPSAPSVPSVPSVPAGLPSLPVSLPGGLPATPSLPVSVPGVPAVPGVPSVPSPAIPGVPSVPSLPVSAPGVPGVPSPAVPGVPSVPSLPVSAPAVPGVPGVPSVPSPAVPGVPSVPSLPVSAPAVPGVPAVPSVKPAVPSVPAVPVVPSVPAAPAVPVVPSVPSAPAVPAVPVAPSVPAAPAVPATPNVGGVVGGIQAPAITAPQGSTPGGILVSNNPTLCPPKNGLGPMVPCGSQVILPTTKPINPLTSMLVNSSPKGTGLPISQPTLPTVLMSTTTITDLLLSTRPVSSPTSTPRRVFNANARDNVAAYFGSTPATSPTGLGDLCSNTNVDIVILAFLYDFFSANGYPTIDFGSSCTGRTTAQSSIAPGLKNCSSLASQIQTCQSLGKKVLLSLGGYIANSSFTSDLEARNFAVTLWNLFGAGQGVADLRPFGQVSLDGFDIDNEDGKTAHWDAFTSAMRALFKSDSTKTYYLSAAPQCPYPDASIPLSTLQQTDFVFVQFYNNPSCNLDSPGFQSSFGLWSKALTNSSLGTSPRVYVGAPAFSGAGSGYVSGSTFASRVALARNLSTSNFGGIMLWDGSEGMIKDQSGHSYLQYAKSAVQ